MKWTALVESYLRDRRNLGYKLVNEGKALEGFASYAEDKGVTLPLNITLAQEWANLAPSGSDIAIARRMSLIRGFSLYLHLHYPSSPVIPTKLIGRTHRRLPPYIYSRSEVAACLDEASRLLPAYGIRPLTIRTLLGLLAATGLRPGEAIRLKIDDVNLETKIITVNESKNWQRRLIPIDASASSVLSDYRKIRKLFEPMSQSNSFFLMDDGKELKIDAADHAFQVIRKVIGLDHKVNGRYPRLYDFRHTFVCRRVQSWYESGLDVHNLVPQLSRYLGHKKIQDTYWYLSTTHELMGLAAQRFSDYCQSGGGL